MQKLDPLLEKPTISAHPGNTIPSSQGGACRVVVKGICMLACGSQGGMYACLLCGSQGGMYACLLCGSQGGMYACLLCGSQGGMYACLLYDSCIVPIAARFSPDDKFSRQRIILKKRFGLLVCQTSPITNNM